MQRRRKQLSDAELSALIQGLREDVAAPADFRAKVMQRLQAEGLVKAAAPLSPVGAGWRERVAAFFSPQLGLGAGALAVLALAYVALSSAPKEALQAPAMPAVTAAAPAPHPVIARVPRSAKPAVALAQAPVAVPAPLQQVEIQGEAPAPAAQGRSEASPAATTVQVAGIYSKPTVVVVETPIVPQGKPLEPGSEVRNNVVRASRGEAALVFFDLPQGGHVRVEVFDRLGRSVAVLLDGDSNSGQHSLRWTGSSDRGGMAASGIYEVRITGPGLMGRHKVLLAK